MAQAESCPRSWMPETAKTTTAARMPRITMTTRQLDQREAVGTEAPPGPCRTRCASTQIPPRERTRSGGRGAHQPPRWPVLWGTRAQLIGSGHPDSMAVRPSALGAPPLDLGDTGAVAGSGQVGSTRSGHGRVRMRSPRSSSQGVVTSRGPGAPRARDEVRRPGPVAGAIIGASAKATADPVQQAAQHQAAHDDASVEDRVQHVLVGDVDGRRRGVHGALDRRPAAGTAARTGVGRRRGPQHAAVAVAGSDVPALVDLDAGRRSSRRRSARSSSWMRPW